LTNDEIREIMELNTRLKREKEAQLAAAARRVEVRAVLGHNAAMRAEIERIASENATPAPKVRSTKQSLSASKRYM
jgi:hypothetical protein